MQPLIETLEHRLLLYSDLGDQWTHDSRITYSFMPDGTSVGGVPSALFQTLNAKYPPTTWEQQIEQAASLWESVTNANLALVPDGGEAVGVSGDQQDDPRFGDIRIGAVPLAPGVLAETFLPPPANGGTDAGDILLNSNVNWQINSNYDLQTVVAHEFGHALGLGESSVSTAVMYGTYNGIKQALTSDDISGIDSIYGTRQYDQFNTGGHRNNTTATATNLNLYITGNAQIAVPSLDITTTGDTEWFYATVPWTTTGTMTVTVQSSNLSSLSPSLVVYNSSLGVVGQTSAPASYGATISVTASVAYGQTYFFKVLAAGGTGPIGGYGLLVNFGNHAQSPIPPPNTVVAQQPDQGGGIEYDKTPSGSALSTIGSISSWFQQMIIAPSAVAAVASSDSTQAVVAAVTGVDPDAVEATTEDASTATAATSSDLSSTTSGSTPVVVAGPGSLILQAVDEALGQMIADG